MKHLDNLNFWYKNLEQREKTLVTSASIILLITLFYVTIWEPVYSGLEDQQELYISQQNTLLWMHQASAEIKSLKQSGGSINKGNKTQAISLVVEQSASAAGLKKNISKLESSGKSGAQARLEMASFDQMLIWINTLRRNYNINITSANIERTDKPGAVNARLTFSR